MSKNQKTAHDTASSQAFQEAAAADPQAHYKCLRNPEDGSMYYGEVAFIRKSNGQVIKSTAPVYETEIKPLQ